jgi:hypothetical protein
MRVYQCVRRSSMVSADGKYLYQGGVAELFAFASGASENACASLHPQIRTSLHTQSRKPKANP